MSAIPLFLLTIYPLSSLLGIVHIHHRHYHHHRYPPQFHNVLGHGAIHLCILVELVLAILRLLFWIAAILGLRVGFLSLLVVVAMMMIERRMMITIPFGTLYP